MIKKTVNFRILLIDDQESIHQDFRKILSPASKETVQLETAECLILGYPEQDRESTLFTIDSVYQGGDGLRMVKEAVESGDPYAMAFVDMRMPPGWDGLRTIQEIWKVDSSIQIVICTAYSDRSWYDMQKKLIERDRWMVVKKPFDQIEVLQMAHALTSKWDMTRLARMRQSVLESLVAARTEQLTAALQTNSDFLDHVSHEMLTPMNGVMGFLSLLSESDLSVENADFMTEARDCSEQLLRLINQVLAYNEAGSGDTRPISNSVYIREWLPGVLQGRLYSMAEKKGLELSFNINLKGNSKHEFPVNIVERVLALLVENAIKFTWSGSISVSISEFDSAALVFEVIDTGVGLSAKELEFLDIPFAQIDGSLTRSCEGIGIGLPLTRRLLKLIGSALEFDSLSGKGTRISFRAPIESEPEPL